MSARAHISLKVKLASALLQMRGDDGEPLIPYEDAKLMTADQIVSLFHFDHGILHAFEPINKPWNLTPRLIAPHRRKSAKDKAIVAKSDRIKKAQDDHKDRLYATEIAYGGDCDDGVEISIVRPRSRPKHKIPTRANPWPPKGSRKLPSRKFARTR